MSISINIRQALEKDLEAISNLWIELMDFHAERDSFYQRGKMGHIQFTKHIRDRLADTYWNHIVVAEHDKVIVGYCFSKLQEYYPVFDRDKYGEIVDIAVSSEYRKHHIGESLVNDAINWFRSKNIERVHATISVKNEVSTKFWRRMGFSDFKETLYKNI